MKRLPNTTKNCHYVSQFFLRFHAFNGTGNILRLKRDELKVRPKSINAVCSEDDYFNFVHDGVINTALEGMISKWEAKYSPGIKRLVKDLESRNIADAASEMLQEDVEYIRRGENVPRMDDMISLSAYSSMLLTFSPRWRKAKGITSSVADATRVEDLISVVEDTIHATQIDAFKPIFFVLPENSPTRLITSDHPFRISESTSYLALTPRILVGLIDSGQLETPYHVTECSDNMARNVNYDTAKTCNEYILGSQKDIILEASKVWNDM